MSSSGSRWSSSKDFDPNSLTFNQDVWTSTVLGSKSFEEIQRLPEKDKVAFYQIAALFESIGVLVDRGFVSLATIDDMFVPEQAWQKLSPFVEGINKGAGEEVYVFFRKLSERMKELRNKPPASNRVSLGPNPASRSLDDQGALRNP